MTRKSPISVTGYCRRTWRPRRCADRSRPRHPSSLTLDFVRRCTNGYHRPVALTHSVREQRIVPHHLSVFLDQTVPEDMRIVFRIGLHLGDLIVYNNDLYGDGMSVAARLETWVQAELAPHYSRVGRPSIDPVLMIRVFDRRLHVRHPVGAPALPGGSGQPRSCIEAGLVGGEGFAAVRKGCTVKLNCRRVIKFTGAGLATSSLDVMVTCHMRRRWTRT